MLESYSWAFGEYLEVQKGARQFSSDNKIQLSMRVPAYASPDIGIPRKVVMRRLVVLGLLKRKVPIQGDRRPAIARTGVATVRTRRRQVFATALADFGSWARRLLQVNRAAATGRERFVFIGGRGSAWMRG